MSAGYADACRAAAFFSATKGKQNDAAGAQSKIIHPRNPLVSSFLVAETSRAAKV